MLQYIYGNIAWHAPLPRRHDNRDWRWCCARSGHSKQRGFLTVRRLQLRLNDWVNSEVSFGNWLFEFFSDFGWLAENERGGATCFESAHTHFLVGQENFWVLQKLLNLVIVACRLQYRLQTQQCHLPRAGVSCLVPFPQQHHPLTHHEERPPTCYIQSPKRPLLLKHFDGWEFSKRHIEVMRMLSGPTCKVK